MALLILVLFAVSGLVSTASVPVSVHYREDATFSWPLPASARGKQVTVVNPSGQPVLDWGPGCTVTPSSVYTHRVYSSCQDTTHVTFTLLGVTWPDEGSYTCRAVTSSGPQIEDCGQNLTLVKVPPQVHIELNISAKAAGKTEGKYLTLTCEVTKAEPSVPEDGYSWSYLPSYQGQVQRLEGKTRTLTLGPLTTQDSGQYFCEANNDPDNRWNIDPVTVSVALNESCIDALLRSEVSPKAVVEKDGDRYKAVFELAQHPKLLLVQHPNTSIITDWHPPCNFSVTPPFKDRVTNTSCDMCRRALSFSLDKLRKEDLGWYQCYDGIINGTKLDSCSVELISKVPILVHMEPVTPDHVVKVTERSNLTLTCVVTQALPPVPEDGYSWSYLPSPQGQLRHLVGKTRTLTLCPLTRRDSGQYFCEARNDLSNRGKIPPGNASVTVDVFYLGRVKSMSDLKVNEGDHVTLTCSVDSKPAARLAWEVEGQEVLNVTGNEIHYMVERAACSDSKTYTCRASNPDLPAREETAFTTLTVNCAQAQVSQGHEWWQITFIVLLVLLLIMLPIGVGVLVYCFRCQGRISWNSRHDEIRMESQPCALEQITSPSEESNINPTEAGQPTETAKEVITSPSQESEATPMAEQPPEAVSGLPNLDDPEKLDLMVDLKNSKASRPGESTSDMTPKADNSSVVDQMDMALKEGEREPLLKESKEQLPRPRKSTSEMTAMAENSSEVDQTDTMSDEEESKPLLEAKEAIKPLSQESKATSMAEQPPEAVSGLANLDDPEKTDLVVDLRKGKGPVPQSGESTSDTTPGADNSADVDQMDTTPNEAEREPLHEESEGPVPRPGESTSDTTPGTDNSSDVDHMDTTPDEAEREPLLEGDGDTA